MPSPLSRPDLTTVSLEISTYIAELEKEIIRLKQANQDLGSEISRLAALKNRPFSDEEGEEELPEILEAPEEPTTICVITSTPSGIAKRTYRHLYSRQKRGGMGIFDLETSEQAPPTIITLADQNQGLLLLTQLGRAFRLPANLIPISPVRARGESILTKFALPADEQLAAILPERAEGYLALVTERGMVRLLRHHIFGEYMKPGTLLYEIRTFGHLVGACWTPGESDLFIVTRKGRAIRFSEKLVPPQGTLGIRLEKDDAIVGITSVYPDSGVFLLSADGKGTIRQMTNFAPNKAPGAGGKIAISTDNLISAINIDQMEDIFIISRLSKIIRFRVSDIPPKDGVVQGVICMSLRADEPMAVAVTQ